MNNQMAADAAGTRFRTDDTLALSRACAALWVATLSLMTAFMQTSAPAHRYLIARKIAKNLSMLREEEACFSSECRMIFANLSQRWSVKAEQLARIDGPHGGMGSLHPAVLKQA